MDTDEEQRTRPDPAPVLPDLPLGAVVVGTDGSDGAARAVDWAVAHAVRTGRPLVVVTGIGPLGAGAASWMGTWEMYTDDVLERIREGGRAVADAEVLRVRASWPTLAVSAVTSDLDARQALLEAAPVASLLVVGSRGHGPIGSLLLGSVGAACARHAACPVVVVRPTERPSGTRRGEQADGPGPRHSILVGVEDGPDSRTVLEHAFAEAELSGASITARLCVHDPIAALTGPLLVTAIDPSDLEVMRSRLVLAEALVGFGERFPDVPVVQQVARGLPEQCLVTDSAEHDLVVVGRHTRGRWSVLVRGSVAPQVVEHASCPVLVVPLDTAPA